MCALFLTKMKKLSPFLELRLKKILLHHFSSIPGEFISDAIGDAYTIFLMKAPQHIKEDPAKTFTWMLRVASRRLSAECKRLARFVRESNQDNDTFSIQTENDFENTETIRALMEHLSPTLRETAEIHFIQGYSYQEISEIFGINLKAVKKRLERAITEFGNLACKRQI